MPKRRYITLIASLIVAAGFVLGLGRLIVLRFDQGDMYPTYSSLRTDPRGAKALYESLQRLDGMTVRRNYKPIEKLTTSNTTTLLLLSTPPNALGQAAIDRLTDFVESGGRLVISLAGQTERRGASCSAATRPVDLGQAFGFSMGLFPHSFDKTRYAVANEDFMPVAGPNSSTLTWIGETYFTDLDESWRTLYECAGRAVLMEQPLGTGTVVLAADSFPLSNEALRYEPRPNLLAWLVGRQEVILDEWHLGVIEQTGIVALARQHGLTGIGLGLLMIAALFIWKRSASFMPPDAAQVEQLGGSRVAGRSGTLGLVSLLRRSVPSHELLDVCFKQWQRTSAKEMPGGEAIMRKIDPIVAVEKSTPAKHRDTVGQYRQICRIISQRK